MGEIFSREFAVDSLPFTGERLTSAVTGVGHIEVEHFHRYFIARECCRGHDVLDVGSREGYGSALLAQVASSVIGVEISRAAVAHAQHAYPYSPLRFVVVVARQLP